MAYTFQVNDMSCGGCAASIRQAIERVPGVQSIEADLPSHRVVVKASAEVSSDIIVAAMNEAGYSEITVLDTVIQ